jgi:penicillin-insensitive murein endopeptidase
MRIAFVAFIVMGLIWPVAAQTPLPPQRPAATPAVKPATITATVTPSASAKELFGRATTAAALAARAIGTYIRGCLSGAVALPVDGKTWQVMRLSRNRNWGHPRLIEFLERFAARVPAIAGWPGILVGDLAQPRGGPMLTGHLSHQIGLDADIWLTPMPDRTLTREEREEMSAVNMVAEDWNDVDPKAWTAQHLRVIKAAAEDPLVERVLVNPAIKKALCREAGTDRHWLRKVRPWYGHNWHMHVRIGCPAGSAECKAQDPVPPGDGCGTELAWWFSEAARKPRPKGPERVMKISELPAACSKVLVAP